MQNQHKSIFVISGTTVLMVITTDFDEGANALVNYELVEPPTSSTGAAIFRIGQTNGVLTTNVGLDREIRDSYEVVVRAYDSGVPSQESKLLRKSLCLVVLKLHEFCENFKLFVLKLHEFCENFRLLIFKLQWNLTNTVTHGTGQK